MLRRMFGLFLICSVFTMTAQAGVAQQNSLKVIFDELQYSLSVEWDQKDKDFYKSTMKTFQSRVDVLRKQGLTNKEIVDFAVSQSKDPKAIKEIEALASDIAFQALPKSQQRKIIAETVAKSYAKGANWSGGVVAATLVLIIVAAVIIAAAGGGGTVVVDAGYGCYDEYVCYEIYDDWGYYLGDDCYYETFCY